MKNLARKLWANKFAKEFALMIASVVAVQLGIGLVGLAGLIDTVKSWGDLLTTFKGWAGSFTFALTITLIKQTIAWAIAALGGSKL